MMPIKDPDESVVIEFDFSSELTTPLDDAVVSVAVFEGVDPAVGSMPVGVRQIVGNKVLQRVSFGVSGVHYALRCEGIKGADTVVRADVMPVKTLPYTL